MNLPKQQATGALTYFSVIYMMLGYCILVGGLLIFELYKPVFSSYTKEILDTIILLDAGRGVTSILILYSLIYGMVMMAVGLLGIYTSSVRGVCELRTFASILGILSICKIVIGVTMILISLNVLLPLQVWGYMTVNFVKMESDENSVQAQIFLQEKYECCGVNNYTDYIRLYSNATVFNISHADNCTTIDETKFVGCESKVSMSYFCQWQIMGIASLCLSLLEIIGIVLTHRFIKNSILPKREFNGSDLPRYYVKDDLNTY